MAGRPVLELLTRGALRNGAGGGDDAAVAHARLSLPQVGWTDGSVDSCRSVRTDGSEESAWINSYQLTNRHTHVVVSSCRLWAGESAIAPVHLADVFAKAGGCVVDLAERLMASAFGSAGPTNDVTILCARLR